MTMLDKILNPPQTDPNKENAYKFNNDVQTNLTALNYVMNPSVVTNANFATLGTHGQSPITTDTDISSGWNVVGAAHATFTITSASYPSNSLIQSASPYYLHVEVADHDGGDFYFYQQQNNTVRKYQKNNLIYGLIIKNNQNKVIQVRTDIFSYYDTGSDMVTSKSIYLQPGINTVGSQVLTNSLSGLSVGASPYTQFRFVFVDLVDGTADIEIYQIKCEFGIASTLLQQ